MNEETILDWAKIPEKRLEAMEFTNRARKDNKEQYERALEIVNKLGLGGLWNGLELALMVVIKGLQEESE